MKLYLLSQSENNGYDTYDSCVVCAENEDEAKSITPNFSEKGKAFEPSDPYGVWAYSLEGVKCKYIGEASDDLSKGVVIASFNAG